MVKKSIKPLETAVANSYAMYMNYKRYHWNTFGPLFRDIHLLFDSHAEPVLNSADDFGERARILGAEAIGNAEEVVKYATVKHARSGMSMKEMIEQAVAKRMGATIVSVASSHVAMISHPDDVTKLIIQATESAK